MPSDMQHLSTFLKEMYMFRASWGAPLHDLFLGFSPQQAGRTRVLLLLFQGCPLAWHRSLGVGLGTRPQENLPLLVLGPVDDNAQIDHGDGE